MHVRRFRATELRVRSTISCHVQPTRDFRARCEAGAAGPEGERRPDSAPFPHAALVENRRGQKPEHGGSPPGCAPKHDCRLAGALRRRGLQKIQEIENPGPEPGQQSIPSDVMETLKERLAEPEGFGSYTDIHCWLAEEHGVELCYSTVHGMVRYELEVKPKVPRPSHPKKRAGANRRSGGSSRLSCQRRDGGMSACSLVLPRRVPIGLDASHTAPWSYTGFVDVSSLSNQSGETMPRTRPPYPQKFRIRIVDLARNGRKPSELAEEFEPTEQTIRNWIKQADRDEGKSAEGLSTDERDELRKLRKKLRPMKQERDILAKATASGDVPSPFAREAGDGPPTSSSSGDVSSLRRTRPSSR